MRRPITVAVVLVCGVLLARSAASDPVSLAVPLDIQLGWMLRVALATVAVAWVPGLLTVLAWHPRREFDLLECAGLGLAVGFGVNQLVTIGAITFHWSPAVSIVLLTVWCAVTAVRAHRRRARVAVPSEQVVLVAALAVLAVYLYASGSRYDNMEDRIHVAISERLAHLPAPSLRNIYYAPGVVYTYPFPGTHYLVALIARVGGMPVIFAYAKLRPFWCVAALLLLHGCVRYLLDHARAATAATLAAAVLVANGAFAAVGMYWGQLAPFSHASDVAMNVLLPALLFVTFAALRADDRREFWFALTAATALTLTLLIVHIREIAQYGVYVGAFLAVAVAARAPRPLVLRTLGIVATAAGLVVAYRAWSVAAVPHVTTLVDASRADLRALFAGATAAELFGTPYPLMRNYMPAFEPLLYGWNPVVLLASPLILFAVRRRPLTWLVAASLVCYGLIVRFPAFGIPYVYATYFEILYTPVRNVVFFVYVLAGVGVYLLAVLLARLHTAWLLPAALLTAGAVVVVTRTASPIIARQIDVLFVPLLVGNAAVLAVVCWSGRQAHDAPFWSSPSHRWPLALCVLLAVLGWGTRTDEAAVVRLAWHNPVATPSALLAALPCTDDMDCPPPPALIQMAHTSIPADSVFAVDLHETYQPAIFMPQQMVIWTGGTDGLLEPDTLFPRYFKYLRAAQTAGLPQPLFVASEPPEQRRAFLRDLAVTHILVNPPRYREMKPVFDGERNLLVSLFDDGRWALYAVRHP